MTVLRDVQYGIFTDFSPDMQLNVMVSLLKIYEYNSMNQIRQGPMSKVITSQSVDQQEVAAFTQQAALWWDEKGPFKPLHQINPIRLTFIRDEIVNHFSIQ